MRLVTLLVLLSGLSVLGAAGPRAAGSDDPDWPCIQRKVPEVSAGMVWAGPPIEDLEADWRADSAVKDLAKRIAARSVAMEDAQKEIGAFASGLGPDKDRRLTLLFSATLATVNAERNAIIGGIGRYARRQTRLAERIGQQSAELDRLSQDGGEDVEAKRQRLLEQQAWDVRIFNEREGSLTYICEQPVILEQRLFALAREMMSYLD